VSVDNPNVIDGIGVTRDAAIELVVSDHLEWDDANEHLLILQEKLNRYLAFIESGEVLERYPQAANGKIRIEAVFKFTPTAAARHFLAHARTAIQEAGFEFTWRVFDAALSKPADS